MVHVSPVAAILGLNEACPAMTDRRECLDEARQLSLLEPAMNLVRVCLSMRVADTVNLGTDLERTTPSGHHSNRALESAGPGADSAA